VKISGRKFAIWSTFSGAIGVPRGTNLYLAWRSLLMGEEK